MPYYTPPGGDITAAYGRSLMGLGAPVGYYAPNFRRTLNGLGALRFNRAVARGMYTLPFQEVQPRRQLGHLGQTSTSSPLLWLGGGLLALAGLLYFRKGGGGNGGSRRVARLAARRALATKQLRELGA